MELPVKWREQFWWAMLLAYVIARISQLYADRLPTLLIVILHVVPPALLAIAHGSALYGTTGMSAFAFFCLGFGTLAESLSLRTGFPFGHYYFTDVMGPKISGLPVLLALAYLGIGYASWILALLILGRPGKPIEGLRVVTLPLLASVIMVAWDLAMDPAWAALDHAWVWRDGGFYFGVPLSNFFGWFLTGYLYYQAFALFCKGKPPSEAPLGRRFWLPVILLYAVCALGNSLVLRQPMAPLFVTDPGGRQWPTSDILAVSILVSLLVMTPFAWLAWLKTARRSDRPAAN